MRPSSAKAPALRSQEEMFLVLVTDAVATMYPTLGLAANQSLTLDALRAKMAQAGLLEDVSCDD